MKNNLSTMLQAYGESDYYPLHMPGHKRRLFGNMPPEALKMDITEIDGFDNLHDADGILKEAQEEAAALYGAEESFFLVNGSTCGILSAVSAALQEGQRILITRNCHKSVYHAAYLRNLTISYLYPKIIEAYDICEAVTAVEVEEALQKEKNVGAVLVVSPTYEGRIAEIEKIAETVHQRGIPLIVDEAHGAHLGLYEGFAQNSCRLGADLVIHSVHKTLPAMTQTALLHVNGRLIDRDRLRRFLHIYQSSSPSYVLMAGIQNALCLASEKAYFAAFETEFQKMREQLLKCKVLKILAADRKTAGRSVRQDMGKVVVSCKGAPISGQELYDTLRLSYHLQLEMAAETYVLAMFTVGDTKEGFERFTRAILEIDGRLADRAAWNMEMKSGCKEENLRQQKSSLEISACGRRLQEGMPFAKAWEASGEGKTEWVPLPGAAGRMAGEFVNLYPPGTPLAVPGEIYSEALLQEIDHFVKEGLNVQGIRREGEKIVIPVLKNE